MRLKAAAAFPSGPWGKGSGPSPTPGGSSSSCPSAAAAASCPAAVSATEAAPAAAAAIGRVACGRKRDGGWVRRHNQPGEQSAALPVRVCNLKQAWGECAATGGSLSQGAAALRKGLSAATASPLGTLRAKAPHTCPRGTHPRKAGDGQWDANRVTADAKVCQGQRAQRGQHAQQHAIALRLRLQGTAPEGAVVKEWWDCYGRLAVKRRTTLADTAAPKKPAAGVHLKQMAGRERLPMPPLYAVSPVGRQTMSHAPTPVPTPTCARPATACPSYLEPAAVANLQRPQRAGTPKRGRHCLKTVA